jgi:hypothetical protein
MIRRSSKDGKWEFVPFMFVPLTEGDIRTFLNDASLDLHQRFFDKNLTDVDRKFLNMVKVSVDVCGKRN